MIRKIIMLTIFGLSTTLFSQELSQAKQFWTTLQSLCDKSFEGTLELPQDDPQFGGKK